MPRKILFVVIAVMFLSGGFILLTYLLPEDFQAPNRDRLEQRLRRPSVRFHVALRERLAREGRKFGRRVEASIDSAAEAQRLANELLEVKSPSDPSKAVLPALGAADIDAVHDRFFTTLAMVAQSSNPGHSLPEYVLMYEAERLSIERVNRRLRGLVVATRAYAYSLGGYCELIEEDLRRFKPLPAVDTDSFARFIQDPIPEEQRETIGHTLTAVQLLLIDGARACCAVRQERPKEAADHLAASVRNLAQLDVAKHRRQVLKAWQALLSGDRERARRELDSVEWEKLSAVDQKRKSVVRDAIATPGPGGANEALWRSVDRKWLSQMILEGAFEALAKAGIDGLVAWDPTATAARKLVDAEHKLMEAARLHHPLFDHSTSR